MHTLDLNTETDRICKFICNYLQQSGLTNVVVGLSGGVDSSLSAALAAQALGKEHVIGVMLPYKNSSPASYDDALLLAESIGLKHAKIDISPMVDTYFSTYKPEADALRRGNWMARVRMNVLYDISSEYQALVVGTSNRTELLAGYFTQHGDGACAFEPIGHLYKTEVWQLAGHLNLPQQIIGKTPTADLWADQTDESELGLPYPALDEILFELTEGRLSSSDLTLRGFDPNQVQRALDLMHRSAFKRQLPPMLCQPLEKE